MLFRSSLLIVTRGHTWSVPSRLSIIQDEGCDDYSPSQCPLCSIHTWSLTFRLLIVDMAMCCGKEGPREARLVGSYVTNTCLEAVADNRRPSRIFSFSSRPNPHVPRNAEHSSLVDRRHKCMPLQKAPRSMSNTSCTAPQRSGPCLFCEGLFLYVGSMTLFSYVSLFLPFGSRSTALYPAHPFFLGHLSPYVAAPHSPSSSMRPLSRTWL